MSAGTRLAVAGLARRVLDGIIDHWAAAPDGVEPLPDRRVIAAGNPRLIAWDCPQLVVTLSGIGWGTPGGGAGSGRQTSNPVAVHTRHAVIVAQLVRPIPVGSADRPPSAERITAAGVALLDDAAMLSQALTEVAAAAAADRVHGTAVPGAVETVGPDGGHAAVEGALQISLVDLA